MSRTGSGAQAEARRGNVRTALVLASVAVAFFAGVIAKHWLFG